MYHKKQTLLTVSLLVSVANFASAQPPGDDSYSAQLTQVAQKSAQYKLPSQKVIADILEKNTSKDFVTKTNLAERLADQENLEIGIYTAFESAVTDYVVILSKSGMPQQQVTLSNNVLESLRAGFIKALINASTPL